VCARAHSKAVKLNFQQETRTRCITHNSLDGVSALKWASTSDLRLNFERMGQFFKWEHLKYTYVCGYSKGAHRRIVLCVSVCGYIAELQLPWPRQFSEQPRHLPLNKTFTRREEEKKLCVCFWASAPRLIIYGFARIYLASNHLKLTQINKWVLADSHHINHRWKRRARYKAIYLNCVAPC
jgi:hypothetical protein